MGPGRGLALLLLLGSLLLLPFPGAGGIRNPDEPRDAEVAREFADGTWSVIPRLNGEPYWSKPPLYFAAVGLGMKAFGQTEGTVTAVAALFGLATVLATGLLAEELLGRGTGLLAGLLLLGIPWFQLKSRIGTTDNGLAALTTISLLLLFRARRGGSWRLAALGGFAAGLASLAKALHGLLFPFLVLGAFLAWRREGRAFLRLRLWLSLALGAAVFAVWVWILGVREDAGGGPEAVRTFLLGNFERRFGEEAHHEGGPFHYAVLAIRTLPWSLPAAAGAVAAFTAPPGERARFRGPLCWAAAMVLALSLASGKRDIYLLPVMPAMALLAAGAVDAAARGVLGHRLDRFVRGSVAVVAAPLLPLPAIRRLGPRGRAGAAAVLVAAASLAFAVLVEGPRLRAESARPLAERAAALAGDRPLVLFRIGQGDVGQFAFPLRRTLPAAGDGRDLRRIAAGRPVVVLAEKGVVERRIRKEDLDPALAASLRHLEDGQAGGAPYSLYEWDGR